MGQAKNQLDTHAVASLSDPDREWERYSACWVQTVTFLLGYILFCHYHQVSHYAWMQQRPPFFLQSILEIFLPLSFLHSKIVFFHTMVLLLWLLSMPGIFRTESHLTTAAFVLRLCLWVGWGLTLLGCFSHLFWPVLPFSSPTATNSVSPQNASPAPGRKLNYWQNF